MSRSNLESIIQSPEAEIFLRMVTKDFYDNSYIGLWIYEVIGREWDEMREWAEGLKNEIHPQTCTWSIGIWEWMYGIEPGEGLALESRRQRVLGKILGVKPINPEVIRRAVNNLLGSSNGWAEVQDFVEPYCFEVILHLTGNKSLNYADILSFIREIKPAHLKMLLKAISEAPEQQTTAYIGGALFGNISSTNLPKLAWEQPMRQHIGVSGQAESIMLTPLSEIESG